MKSGSFSVWPFLLIILPELTIAKSPDNQIIIYSSSALFIITVTNSMPIGLVDVQVVDPLVHDCDRVIGDLVVNESYSYGCSLTNATEDLEDIATVYATTPNGLEKVFN